MTNTTTQTDAIEQAESVLANLYANTPLLRGSVVASPDGLALVSDLEVEGINSIAAVIASSFALGGRLGAVLGSEVVEETVVKCEGGYFALYAAGETGILGVMTMPNTNLGLLNLQARQACAALAPLIDDLVSVGDNGS